MRLIWTHLSASNLCGVRGQRPGEPETPAAAAPGPICRQARIAGTPVVSICDAHRQDDPEFERVGWPPHAIPGTPGAQVVSKLAPVETDPVIEKTSYSGFLRTGLEGVLQSLGVEQLVLTGCVTNICILYTAYEAVVRGYRVRVPTDSVAARVLKNRSKTAGFACISSRK